MSGTVVKRRIDHRWPQRRNDPPVASGQVVTVRCAACSSSFSGSLEDGRDWFRGHVHLHATREGERDE